MSLGVLAATQQGVYLDSMRLSTMPFSTGFWLNAGPTTVGAAFALGASGNDQAFFLFPGSPNFEPAYWNGAATVGAITGIVNTRDVWQYVVWRVISATNRRISVLTMTGGIQHGQNTTSVTPTTLARLGFGMSRSGVNGSFLTGQLAECFYASGDIQPGGAQLDNDLLYRLAFRGPFSVPHIVPMIDEYLSLHDGLTLRTGHFYQAGNAYRQWAALNGPKLAPHPPLRPDYVRPMKAQVKQLLLV